MAVRFRTHDDEGEADSGALIDVEVLWEHRAFVRDLSMSIVGDWSTAEDIAQETLLKAYEHRARLDATQDIRNWLAVVARRRAFDELRRKHRHALPVDELPEPEVASDVVESVVQRDLLAAVTAAISSNLTPREQALLKARVMHDASLEQLATLDGSTAASVRSVLMRARAKLAKSLKAAGQLTALPVLAASRSVRRTAARVGLYVQRMATSIPGSCEMLVEATAAGVIVTAVVSAHLIPSPASPALGATPGRPSTDALAYTTVAHQAIGPPAPRVGSAETEPARIPEAPRGRASDTVGAPEPRTEPAAEPSAPEPPPLPRPPVSNPIGPEPEYQQPEDVTRIQGVYAPPPSDDARDSGPSHVFARGYVGSWVDEFVPALLHSPDGGASWERVDAWGWDGGPLILPPGYPDHDSRIWSLGYAGIQVSTDGGGTFTPIPGSAAGLYARGEPSPRFHLGDQRILVGGWHAAVFDVATGVVAPVSAVPLSRGGMQLAFDRRDATGATFFVGAFRQTSDEAIRWAHSEVLGDGSEAGVYAHVLYRCAGPPTCEALGETPDAVTQVLVTRDGHVIATSQNARSSRVAADDRDITPIPSLDGWYVNGVTEDADGTLYAAAMGWGPGSYAGGIMRSDDGGASWAIVSGAAFEGAASVTVVGPGRLVATPYYARGKARLMCSVDRGATWAQRCPA